MTLDKMITELQMIRAVNSGDTKVVIPWDGRQGKSIMLEPNRIGTVTLIPLECDELGIKFRPVVNSHDAPEAERRVMVAIQ